MRNRRATARSSSLVTGLRLSLRAAVAAVLAVVISRLLTVQFPIYSVIASVLVTDLSPSTTKRLALQRAAGTVLGATIGGVLSYALPEGPLAMGIGITIAMLLSWILRMPGAAKVAGYVCGIVVLAHSANPWLHARNRGIETLIGVGMSVLVSLVPPLNRAESREADDVEPD